VAEHRNARQSPGIASVNGDPRSRFLKLIVGAGNGAPSGQAGMAYILEYGGGALYLPLE
jgi:hypothetical protein